MLSPTGFSTDIDAQFPNTLGPDTGILEVPYKEPQYPCVNDQSNGGICRSNEKVF